MLSHDNNLEKLNFCYGQNIVFSLVCYQVNSTYISFVLVFGTISFYGFFCYVLVMVGRFKFTLIWIFLGDTVVTLVSFCSWWFYFGKGVFEGMVVLYLFEIGRDFSTWLLYLDYGWVAVILSFLSCSYHIITKW